MSVCGLIDGGAKQMGCAAAVVEEAPATSEGSGSGSCKVVCGGGI